MKKFILKLDLHDDKDKRKALKTVSTLSGIDSITINMKERTLTVVGSVDPINVVSKLRKFWSTNIISVGPAKEPEKKEEPKKEEGKKDEAKKDDKKDDKKEEEKKGDAKKDDTKKKEGGKDEEKKAAPPHIPMGMHMPYRPQQMPMGMHMPYRPYYPQPNIYYNQHQPYQHNTYQPHHHSIEENPNACVIC